MFTSQKPVTFTDKTASQATNNEMLAAADIIKDYEAEQFALIQEQYDHCVKYLQKTENNSSVQRLRLAAKRPRRDSSYTPDREDLHLAVSAIYDALILIPAKHSMQYAEFSSTRKICTECFEVINDEKSHNEFVILDKLKQLVSDLDEAGINFLEKRHERRKDTIEECLRKLANYHSHEIKMKITT